MRLYALARLFLARIHLPPNSEYAYTTYTTYHTHTMKKLPVYLLAAGLFFGAGAQAQQQRTCGTMAHEQHLQQQDPTHYKKRRFAEHKLQQWLTQNPTRRLPIARCAAPPGGALFYLAPN